MNATALRKHYSDVRQRLNTPPAKKKAVEQPIIRPVVVEIVKQDEPKPFIDIDESLKETLRWRPKERMLEILCGRGITIEELKVDKREKPYVRARWEIYWMLLNEFGWSRARIGKYFNKDHTTVLHGIKQWEKILKEKTNDNARND